MIIGEICNNESFEKKFYLQKNLYSFLSQKHKKFYFINIFYILNKKKFLKNTVYIKRIF